MEIHDDLHLRSYYGGEDKTDSLNYNEAKDGTTAFHAYVTLHIRVRSKCYTLLLYPQVFTIVPMEVYMKIKLSEGWESQSNVSVYGSAYINGKQLSNSSLINYIQKLPDTPELMRFLKKSKGFFNCIVETNDNILVTTDHVSSKKIYFGEVNDKKFISDDQQWIETHVNPDSVSNIVEVELIATKPGPIQRDTKYKNISRLYPGEVLSFNKDKQIFNTEVYYTPVSQEIETEKRDGTTEEQIKKEFDEKLVSVFERFLEYVDGRQIVLPLSSGYDSTLILLMLERMSYDNVICFTRDDYGNEVNAAKKIAEEVNYPHYTPDISHNDWREFYKNGELDDFYTEVGTLSNISTVGNVPYINYLAENGYISNNAIISPGHTATDMYKRTPERFILEAQISSEEVVKKIVEDPYYFGGHQYMHIQDKDLRSKLRERIADAFKLDKQMNSIGAIRAYEDYVYKTYSNYIWNDVQYEYLNYDWYYPLLDKELFNFWTTVSMKYKLNQTVYHKFIERFYKNITGNEKPPREDNDLAVNIISEFLNYTGFKDEAKSLMDTFREIYLYRLNSIDREKHYQSNPSYGIMTQEKFKDWDLQVPTASIIRQLYILGKIDLEREDMEIGQSGKYNYNLNPRRGIVVESNHSD